MYDLPCNTFIRARAVRLSLCFGLLVLLTMVPSLAATISGTVSQYGGGALSGAVVRTEGEPTYSATTDANGAYSLTVPTGSFTVLASATGYNPQRMSVPSGSGTVNFALRTANTGTALSLPAPLAWGEPPSAPTPPGDSYPIAFADTGAFPDPSAPRISEYNDCVKPDESFTMTGANFTTRTGADAGTDTTVWIWARTSSSSGTLRQAKVWKVSASTIVATVPSDVPFGMYMVWVENSVGASAPICLNRTKTLWVGPIDNNTYAGATKRVFGRNLSYGHGTSQSYVYIQPASGGSFTQCTVTSVEPYAVGFTVPAGTANGNYKVYVHNGQGGVYGWGDGLDLVVQSQWVRGVGQVNVTSNGTDDTTQIQNAINTVSGYTNGGIVQLGTGNYILRSPITIGPNVRLKGAGMNSTNVLLEAPTGNTQYAINVGGNNAAMTDLTVHEVYGYGLPTGEFNCVNGYSGVVLSNVRINSDQGDSNWQNVQAQTWIGVGTEVSGCEMYRQILTLGNCWIHNNNLYGDVGPWYNAEGACTLYCWNNVYENNHTETLNWPSELNYAWWNYYYKIWAKRMVLCYCTSSYVGHNSALNVAVDDNRGEMILFHGHSGFWCGQVLSNSGLTMTVRTDGKVFDQTYTIPDAYGTPFQAGQQIADTWNWWAYNAGRDVVIIAGTGAGQVRLVAWNGGVTPPNQITVDSPWTVQPDSTSVALFTGAWSNNIVYANDLSAFPVGYSFDPSMDQSGTGYASTGVDFDGDSYHNTVEANVSRRTNYGRQINALASGPSLWNDMRDEQAVDINTSGYRIMQWETNPLGPILFGNAIRNCSGNVLNAGSTSGYGAFGQGEGSIIENLNVTSGLGYYVGFNYYGRSGSPSLYRNSTMTASASPAMPVYVNTANGDDILIGNTYPGAGQPYSYNTSVFGLGPYSQLAPLYRVARFTTVAGQGMLSPVFVPIANAGTANMTWSVVSCSPWITASVQGNGTVSPEHVDGSLSITPDSTGMTVGRHWGSVTVYTATGFVNIGVLVDVTSSSQVAAPMFSPPAATQTGSQIVSINTTTPGASIRYTVDGTTPTSITGTVYNGPVSITESTVLKAIAFKSGMTDSLVTTIAVAAPTFSLAYGTYAGLKPVTISTITSGATIRYTVDGTPPSQYSGTVYTGPIALSFPCVLQAIAYKTGMSDSAVTSGSYNIQTNASWNLASDFSTNSNPNGQWSYGRSIGTASNEVGYGKWSNWVGNSNCGQTFNNGFLAWSSAPGVSQDAIAKSLVTSTSSRGGSVPAGTALIMTSDNRDDWAKWTALVSGTYDVNVTFGGVGSSSTNYTAAVVKVYKISGGTYTELWTSYLDGTNTSRTYSGSGLSFASGDAVEFFVSQYDNNAHNYYWDITRNIFTTVDATVSQGAVACAAPTFSPTAGTYSGTQTVTLSTTTSGASIRYTTDGTTPSDTVGTVYGSAISISTSCTLKAIAYKSGMSNSSVTSGAYTIVTGSSWNLASDFSTNSNPNGQWSYGRSIGTASNEVGYGKWSNWVGNSSCGQTFNNSFLAWSSSTGVPQDAVAKSLVASTSSRGGSVPAGTALIMTSDNRDDWAKWTASSSGTYGVNVTFGGVGSNSTNYTAAVVKVYKISSGTYTELWTSYIDGSNTSRTYSASGLSLASGDALEFFVSQYDNNAHNYYWDITRNIFTTVDATVTQQ